MFYKIFIIFLSVLMSVQDSVVVNKKVPTEIKKLPDDSNDKTFEELFNEKYESEFSKYRQEIMNMLTNIYSYKIVSRLLTHSKSRDFDRLKSSHEKVTAYGGLRCDIQEGKESYNFLSNPDYEYVIRCKNTYNTHNHYLDVKLQIKRQIRSWKAKNIIVKEIKISPEIKKIEDPEIAKNFWMIISGNKGDVPQSKINKKWERFKSKATFLPFGIVAAPMIILLGGAFAPFGLGGALGLAFKAGMIGGLTLTIDPKRINAVGKRINQRAPN